MRPAENGAQDLTGVFVRLLERTDAEPASTEIHLSDRLRPEAP